MQSSMGSDLKVLTIKEFQTIEETNTTNRTNLGDYEINNEEFIQLKRIKPTPKTFITFNKTKNSKVHLKL